MIDQEQEARIKSIEHQYLLIAAEKARHAYELEQLRTGLHAAFLGCTHKYAHGVTARPSNTCRICCETFVIPAEARLERASWTYDGA